ncbi:hypothetical protein FW755_11070 [Lonepinella koalarum]|uniref:Uncharacterized protein n=1 Tax=Lonepinella koalarum TaxID=53417 RepID=A0A4R1KST0_9PAST|nr:hypothetical protein [Lonepinella koalarum]MDH2927228.1 hypothetical protein [Lonepinella koalarum]TCK68102.1 hypothetical protein EV692_1801 [Lonepinella koalarum]TFJ89497.1 hypothetical protein E0709_08980 [Lonepinella koalarum]TYG33467.1 hypothetical protein FW755_11070 [Lonepinella koalarum]
MINQKARFRSSHFKQGIYHIKRLENGEYSEEKQLITAIVTPTTPNDLELLPEGERFYPTFKLYLLESVNIGDLVEIQNVQYKIRTFSNWGDYGYYHALAVQHSETASDRSDGFVIT